MISNERFLDLVRSLIDIDLQDPFNREQLDAVCHAEDAVLQIVAGPGSGKTTVLILRALRFVLVDDILPEQILITTFTRKAARELRTRWLDWGTVLCDAIALDHSLEHIDLNRCRIDTLDSIVQETLTDFRPPGHVAPILADETASILSFKRRVFQSAYQNEGNKAILDDLLGRYTFDRNPPRNQGEAIKTAKSLLDRLTQDRVNIDEYAKVGRAEETVAGTLEAYRAICKETNVFDFTLLEEHFLDRLSSGQLNDWTNGLRALFVDEYQDTNPLQEAIYFSIVNSGQVSTTIVGDDDQSMYRFRGGSVELFTDFAIRCRKATSRGTKRVDMVRNFRSHPEVVEFFNSHIENDPEFQPARIDPPKPSVIPKKQRSEIPVLGMFRPDKEALAADLAKFLNALAEHQEIPLDGTGRRIQLAREGALGDAVFLAHTVEEVKYDRFTRSSEYRFPYLLRRAMNCFGLEVFNPRGLALRSIPDVQRLLGLLILCVDPYNSIVEDIGTTSEAKHYLNAWRREARVFASNNPTPSDGHGLMGFIKNWQSVALGNASEDFPSEWPVLELVFKLISWMPDFQSKPEHQVWLEAIARVIASVAAASPYNMQLFQNTVSKDQRVHVDRSRESLVRDALVPIAEDEVQVDEDIMPSVPRDWLPFMTIHQAKGLEFPLVIVDVGSRFKRNHHTQRFLRYPDCISNVTQAEDDVEPFLSAPLRGNREALDRTFDDLVRLYYVAYSRPQSVLMLVGLENCLRYGKEDSLTSGAIPNVALGWRRDGSWPWRQEYTGKRPPVKIEPTPFWEL